MGNQPFFQRLPAADYSPTWYAQRATGGLGPLEQHAASKASAHANTPAIAYFDSLGRTFLTIADNAVSGKYPTHVELDIQNNQRSVTDALDREVMVYDYDMLDGRIHQASMEAGERWVVNDVASKTIRSWDSRGHNFRTAYDALRRPMNLFVLGTDPINSDSRTTAGEILYENIDYGEGQPGDQALNLRARIFQHHDSAGVVTNTVTDPVTTRLVAFDFKGNLLGSSRQFVQDHKMLPDWANAAPAFLPDVFVTITQYDALNRTVAATTPDGSVVHPTYNEANLLRAMGVNLLGTSTATPFVNNIDYNAKGQRVLIEYANDATTAESYDPFTLRLVRLTTARQGFSANQQTVQDLSYTYDPIGNITHIQDDADIQNVVFFNNRRVEPSSDYTYDAIYRLVQGSGREQLGLSGGGPLPPWPTSHNDEPRVALPAPGDGNAMGTYSEQYQYDAVGNFLQFTHRGSDPANPGWTRSYSYTEASSLVPGNVSNRLTRTTVGGSVPWNENYTYDLHGNMTSMPQLRLMSWDFKDQLLMTQRQAVNASDQDGTLHQGERTYYVYNAAGERVRKATESATGVKTKERFYLGTFEVYREYDATGNTALERETLQIVDDKRRSALVETKRADTSAVAGSLPSRAIRYQFDNHLGTACLELDEAAAVISYEEYYPYGSTSYQAGRSAAEVSLKRYRFTGKERDEETGFYYHGARYYAPWIARWLSCDPVAFSRVRQLHLVSTSSYAGMGLNPVVRIDPTGEQDTGYTRYLDRKLATPEGAGEVSEAQAGLLNMAAKGVVRFWSAVEHFIWSPESETNYQQMKSSDLQQQVKPNPALDMTNQIVQETPDVSGKLWGIFAGGLNTGETATGLSGAAAQTRQTAAQIARVDAQGERAAAQAARQVAHEARVKGAPQASLLEANATKLETQARKVGDAATQAGKGGLGLYGPSFLPKRAEELYQALGRKLTASNSAAIPKAQRTTVAVTQGVVNGETRTVVTVTNKEAWDLLNTKVVKLNVGEELGPPPEIVGGKAVHAEVQGTQHLQRLGATGGYTGTSRYACPSCGEAFSGNATPGWVHVNLDPAHVY